MRIRAATPTDIDALVDLENAAFSADRISRRSFRLLVSRPTAATLVCEDEGGILGYAMILFRKGTGLARLYSIAVSPRATGRGVGRALLEAAETEALGHDRYLLRLEVREDNAAAIALYRRAGYRKIGRYEDYYADHTPALRFEKLLREEEHAVYETPFYEQTTDFTCGAACLNMAMGRYVSADYLDPVWEIRFWREATTIFMMSGMGGCEPFGLAVAAHQYGLDPEIYVTDTRVLFLDTVRDPEKRQVMELAQRDFRQRVVEADIPVMSHAASLNTIRAAIARGHSAIVLVSGYFMFGKKVPHWVLAHGDDGRHIILHDPWVEDKIEETASDAANLPVPYEIFDRITRFGKAHLRAAVIIKGKR
ncbi:GNAT family N-acetyltransferase/peptidase C39 family protein [Pararhizobium haloflavum]|uniref:GNAT family N-acetyltransferase/peptidase C39 family protein n=1 Tax=Pararhizobium haloflavum TaxID=2037914 RepID=UPI000C182C4F|nr:GNAT family N-acetyltransferase/peptidase C39 family protein [Pararhizobium haloflavum]